MRGKDQGYQGYQGYLISGWEETRNGFRSTATEVAGPTGELSHTQFGGWLQSVQGPRSRGHSHDCWSRGSYSLFTSMSMTPFPGTIPVFIPDLTILTSSPCWVCLKISTPKFDGWELRTLFLHIFPLLLHSTCFYPLGLSQVPAEEDFVSRCPSLLSDRTESRMLILCAPFDFEKSPGIPSGYLTWPWKITICYR